MPPVTEVVTFTGGETLNLPGAPHIIHLPGHTPGGVAVHAPAADALFVADALTTGNVLTRELGSRPAPFTLDPENALASLTALETVGARGCFPATAHCGTATWPTRFD